MSAEEQPPPEGGLPAPEAAPSTFESAPPPLERDPFWGFSDLLLFLGISIPCMLLGFGMVKGAMWLLHVRTTVRAVELLSAQFAGYALLFLALRAMLKIQYDRPFWQSLGWRETRLSFSALVFLGFVTAIAVSITGYLIRTPTTENPLTELLKDRTSMILIAVFGVTAGPLSEELIFRGFLQPLLVRRLGPYAGILAAALPFGLLHFKEYGDSWRHVLLISLAGTTFGCVRQVTQSTKASTIMHAAYNAVFFLALLSQRSVSV